MIVSNPGRDNPPPGRFDGAITLIEKAERNDPPSPLVKQLIGISFFWHPWANTFASQFGTEVRSHACVQAFLAKMNLDNAPIAALEAAEANQ